MFVLFRTEGINNAFDRKMDFDIIKNWLSLYEVPLNVLVARIKSEGKTDLDFHREAELLVEQASLDDKQLRYHLILCR